MQKITVNASRVYDVLIGRGLLTRMGSLIAAQVKGRSACLVSDSNVWPLHGAAAVKSLEEAGFSVCTFVFPAGEESKNAQTCNHNLALTEPALWSSFRLISISQLNASQHLHL